MEMEINASNAFRMPQGNANYFYRVANKDNLQLTMLSRGHTVRAN